MQKLCITKPLLDAIRTGGRNIREKNVRNNLVGIRGGVRNRYFWSAV